MNIIRLYHWADVPRMAGWALAYLLLARIALTWFAADGQVSLMWPPSGVAVAALLIGGKKYWPAVFAAEMIQSLLNGRLDAASFFIAAGCTLEALACVWLLGRCRSFGPALRRPQDYVWLVLAGAAAACVSAAVGGVTLLLSGVITQQALPHELLSWWQGDMLGAMLVTPAILVWKELPRGWLGKWRTVETVAFLGTAFLAGQAVFLGWFHNSIGLAPLGFWMFPVIVWGAVRYGKHGALLVIAMATVQSMLGAVSGLGFLHREIAETGVLNLWFYLLTLGAVGITLSLVINQRRLAEEKCRSVFEHSSDAILLFNRKRFFDCNQRTLELFGLSGKAEFLACQPGRDLSAPTQAGGVDSAPGVAAHIDAALRNGSEHFEWMCRRKNGELFSADVLFSAFDYGGQRILQATVRDITEKKLWEREQRFHLALESSQDGFYIIDRANMQFINANEAAHRCLGYTLEELLAMGPHDIKPELSKDELAQRFDEIIGSAGKSGAIETCHQRKDGSTFPVEVNLRAISIDGRWVMTAIARDISERRELQQELRRQARTDYLTGLYNRRYFMELAEQEMSRALRYGSLFSVLMLDIDHFKAVNDAYGHKAGDILLRKFADTCRVELREVDIFGRIGGEEFAILLPETGADRAFEVADRLRVSIANAEIPLIQSHALRFTVSIGVVFFDGKETSMEALLNQADEHLYSAKREGRNRVYAGRLG